eukprot:COSAG01_NODE_44640_length_417_cov_0.606918_2_plen_29_part_01
MRSMDMDGSDSQRWLPGLHCNACFDNNNS